MPLGKRIKIAVLDTGLDQEHPFFQDEERLPRIAAQESFLNTRYSQAAIVDSPRDTKDVHGHGTHVAGILLQVSPEADLYIGRVVRGSDPEQGDALRISKVRRPILYHLSPLFSVLYFTVEGILGFTYFSRDFLRSLSLQKALSTNTELRRESNGQLGKVLTSSPCLLASINPTHIYAKLSQMLMQRTSWCLHLPQILAQIRSTRELIPLECQRSFASTPATHLETNYPHRHSHRLGKRTSVPLAPV